MTETESSLPALQELPSHQVPAGYQVKTVKKARHRSRFGKSKVVTEKTQRPNYKGASTMDYSVAGPRPKKKTPYELRDQNLKTEEGNLARRKVLNQKKVAAKN